MMEAPVFHPTLEDMNGDFEQYIMKKVERSTRFAEAGICKVSVNRQ